MSASVASQPKQLLPKKVIDALKKDRRFATTLVSGLELLRCFSSVESMLGNKDLAARTGLPKATVSRLAFTLTSFGYLWKNERLGKYQLGPALLTLSYPLLANMRARMVARRYMRQLAERTGGQASMAVRHGLDAIYVESFHSERDWINRPEIGTTRPIMHTAIGHALIFACTPEERERIFSDHRRVAPERSKEDRANVMRSFRDISTRGFCSIWGTYRSELWAVGVPLRRIPEEHPVALNLNLLAHQTTRAKMSNEYGPMLVDLVRSVEFALGLRNSRGLEPERIT